MSCGREERECVTGTGQLFNRQRDREEGWERRDGRERERERERGIEEGADHLV